MNAYHHEDRDAPHGVDDGIAAKRAIERTIDRFAVDRRGGAQRFELGGRPLGVRDHGRYLIGDAELPANAFAATDQSPDQINNTIAIGRRSLHIASQSVIAGLAMSITAMGFAAAGMIPPVAGALLQEGIDVAVILNALRALR